MRSYEPWKIYLADQKTTKEKIYVWFAKDFMNLVEQWDKTHNKHHKPLINSDLWNSLPLGTDIPMERINFYDGPDVTTLRPYAQLIAGRSRSCIVYIFPPGSDKT